MAGTLPVVSIFGVENVEFQSAGPIPHFETDKMDCRCYLTDDDLYRVLAKDRPHSVISFGRAEEFPQLMNSPFEVRKKWVHYSDTDEIVVKGTQVFHNFLNNALVKREDFPLVTVFTPTYRTGDKIRRPFNSLRSQTYGDWEWVIMDDSDDDGETFEMLSKLSEEDYRVRVFKENRHTGVIGSLKRNACMLGRGKYLVELDHDDELTPQALQRLVDAFASDEEIGFVYTDFAECFEDCTPVTYGEGWGFGYGTYRKENHRGVDYMVVNSPNINPKTIRHIVAAPNHIRAWRASLYHQIGGHSPSIHVADDYEILIRTFLATRMARVPHMCYIQYRNQGGNTHRERNQEIQRLVRYFSQWYDKAIHERFLELGVDDFIWEEGVSSFIRLNSVTNQETESHCTIVVE
jgi:glycosyltransferase involved in cell wall biosynthesis